MKKLIVTIYEEDIHQYLDYIILTNQFLYFLIRLIFTHCQYKSLHCKPIRNYVQDNFSYNKSQPKYNTRQCLIVDSAKTIHIVNKCILFTLFLLSPRNAFSISLLSRYTFFFFVMICKNKGLVIYTLHHITCHYTQEKYSNSLLYQLPPSVPIHHL